MAAVKFEDLHCRPEHMITQIFEHYGIDCDCEIDTRTTCDGKIYVYTASNGGKQEAPQEQIQHVQPYGTISS